MDRTVRAARPDDLRAVLEVLAENQAYGRRDGPRSPPSAAQVAMWRRRRRGVARLMLGRALEDARRESCFKIQLLTHKQHADDGAHDLYRALGFVAEAEGFRLYLTGGR